jgi:hypothetical protein
MLSVADLEGMRATTESAMPDTCMVIDDTIASDGAGGHTIATSTSQTVPCRIAPRLATGTGQLKDAEMDEAGRMLSQSPWLISMPYGTVVSTTSHISDPYGREFEVFAVLARRSDELHTTALCRLINEGAG